MNGKVRGVVELPAGASEDEAVAAALATANVAKFAGGKELKKVIFVPGKILNLIVPGK